jgi:Uma2 family endonuclease
MVGGTAVDTVAVEAPLITGAELLEMGDIGLCELVEGRISAMVPPGGEHGRIETRLSRYLDVFAETHDLGWVMSGETGIYTRRDPDTVRGMDVAFISKQRLPDGPGVGYLETAPELVVEIVSPSDRWQNIEDKISEYLAIGVEQVWVVDPRQRAVFVSSSPKERRRFDVGETLQGAGVLEGFSLTVAALFR